MAHTRHKSRVIVSLATEHLKALKRPRRITVLGGADPLEELASRIEVRINNLALDAGTTEGDRVVFPVRPGYLARGDNLIRMSMTRNPEETPGGLTIEKVELHVAHRTE